MDEIERVLLVKSEVFVYKIPPRQSSRGYRAADWNLSNPDWTGRLRCIAKGRSCEIRLDDKATGQLFAACPVEVYPGMSVEPVTDSSRYFVICIQDSGRKAYIGIGFSDRADSFDLNVALQDHFKWLTKEDGFEQEAKHPDASKPRLDLAFKEGQTIKIKIPSKRDDGGEEASSSAKPRPKKAGAGLPLPPAGAGVSLGRIGPPPSAANLTPMQSPSDTTKSLPSLASTAPATPASAGSSNVDLLGDLLGSSSITATAPAPSAPVTTDSSRADPFDDNAWGDFASASNKTAGSGKWEQF